MEQDSHFSPEFTASLVFVLIVAIVAAFYLLTLPSYSPSAPADLPGTTGIQPTGSVPEPAAPQVAVPVQPAPAAEATPEPAAPLPDYLTPNQAARLESWGVNVDELPPSISGDTETCLIDAVGAQRAEEIKAGSEPSTWEIIKASRCF